jgi:hypothetical protein
MAEASLPQSEAAVDSQGRTIWIVDAHRDDGSRFIVHADEKLSAFVEREPQVPEDWLKNVLLKKDQLRQWFFGSRKGNPN